ncbi:cobalt chelatase [Rhodanobacter sp. FW510-R12]|nr:cobalt chelatase [Rhodanobacter sp. FW104-R8]KZC28374.1 cobalt chelatase [Rhodanobacter sp. FW510-T8]KZC32750.1 cobalt chelatase [Rhodanobacter sp. FW510-R10]
MLLVALALASLFAPGPSAQATSALFVATSNVPPGKFKVLEEIARPHGMTVEVRYLDKLPADAGPDVFDGHDIVFIDSYLQGAVRAKLGKALAQTRLPVVWVYDKAPAAQGMPAALAQRLASYYSNGGLGNFEGFFATTVAWLGGKPATGTAAPVVVPETAIYHPDAKQVFADTESYLRWKKVGDGARPPVIAIAFHEQYVAALQTRLIDHLIRRVEAAGAIPLAFYYPVMGKDSMGDILAPHGRRVADAVITTRIMLSPDEPRREMEKLGIPVIQAMPYRQGDEAEWAADPHGVSLMDVPFYMAQAEYAGIVDIQVASAMGKSDPQLQPIEAQVQTMVNKALRLVVLQRKPVHDKRVTMFFWNYPPGEKNLSASFLNLPRSLVATLTAMQHAGYDTHTADADELTARLQRLLAPYYRSGRLQGLLDDDLAVRLPVADYTKWLATLPAPVRERLLRESGDPATSPMVLGKGSQTYFVIPRLRLGKVTLMPQPPRSGAIDDREKALYHSTTAAPSHFYLAAYLWARSQSDAFVHFGTHGTQEWLPGKERGLSVYDDPMLALGDVPVVYPYIADNIGEALQARRRGRAVIISHQTPPFRPAGLHDELTAIHDLLHRWLGQMDGAVRTQIMTDLLARTASAHIDLDMGWTPERASAEFPAFVDALHAHLHELAQTAQPLGLHTFGTAPATEHRLATVLLMLGTPFRDAAARHAGVRGTQLEETLAIDYDKLVQSPPYALLRQVLVEGRDPGPLDGDLAAMLKQARQWYADIGAAGELPGLLDALAGRYVPTSYGGDPIKRPDAYPTGRNLYPFDPSRVPTQQAWEAGKKAAEELLQAHRRDTGQLPDKLTFSLWSVETMRHEGLLEAQALWLLGVEPVWDKGGRVEGVRLVDRKTLGRARVDVVLSITGLYRDHFPNVVKQLARAAQLAALADEADNPVAAHSKAVTAELLGQGVDKGAATAAGQTRVFSSASGRYGTGLDDATLASDSWKGKAEGDRKLAELYLSKMQYAYGPDPSTWGNRGVAGNDKLNLYASHLRGTDGAVLSRTSNTYGMLTTDDPFQYLGGIGLAVRHLDGKPPKLYISNLRGGGSGKVEDAAGFLAKELSTREFHPGYIKALVAEGYAGTLSVLESTNNLWGWTAVAREVVRDDQWEEMADVYVRDKYKLGLDAWFEKENPHAQAQIIERMLEASRQGYWNAKPATLETLKQRYRDLATRFDVHTDNAPFLEYVASGAPAEVAGTPAEAAAAAPSTDAAATPAPMQQVSGMQLEKTAPADSAPSDPRAPWISAALALCLATGAARQIARRPRPYRTSHKETP